MTHKPNPILFYHPDGYRVAREDLKGRHSAGESFLTAFLEQAEGPDVYALCEERGFEEFAGTVKSCGRQLNPRRANRNDVETLRAQGLLYLPFPGIAQEARTRSFLDDRAYALCGVTHTISSRQVLDGVADLAIAPVMPWDALICTSKAVHDALTGVLTSAENDLRARLGASKFTRPMMPIIPLGVHARRFARKDVDRVRWRAKLGVADDAVVVLFFGRLSVHAKASPFQLAQAVEAASRAAKRPFAIIWCGWFNDDFQRRVFMNTAKSMAPSVPFHHVDGRDEDTRFSIWSAADIFCSLSDNIQESFGLTVIEAMAAGLPIVVSNWNGYREAVEHGVNGILIDIYMPEVSLSDAAYRYISGIDTYDLYIGGLSQLCVIDVDQTAHWLARLADDEALRRKLAVAAKKTVEVAFEWATVMPRYFALWREQIERIERARREQQSNTSATWRSLDPTSIFAGFPSHRLAGETLLARGPFYGRWTDLVKQPGIIVNGRVLMGRAQLQAVHKTFAEDRPLAIDKLLEAIAVADRPAVLRSLHWLIKVGLLRIVPQKSAS